MKGSDKVLLNQFIETILPLLPENNWEDTNSPNSSIFIAIDRYFEALKGLQSQESKITAAITCLEALFLKSEERAELSHKLAQRAAYLVSKYSIVPLQAYRSLKNANNIRSTYIHGSMISKGKRKGLRALIEDVLNYCRLSIIVFLEISNTLKKEELISSIDNAILDDNANNKLAARLKKLKLAIN